LIDDPGASNRVDISAIMTALEGCPRMAMRAPVQSEQWLAVAGAAGGGRYHQPARVADLPGAVWRLSRCGERPGSVEAYRLAWSTGEGTT